MTNARPTLNGKFCVKCDGSKSSGGLFTCDGCKQMFCSRHVNEHRQELEVQLENAMLEHDLIQEESNRCEVDQTLFTRINQWEQTATMKIRQSAEQLRTECLQLHQDFKKQIKEKCTKLAENLRLARENDDYAEFDLNRWTQTLSDIRKDIQSIKTIDIIENSRASISLIQLRHHIDLPIQKDSNTATSNSPPSIHRPLDNNRPYRRRRTTAEVHDNNNRPAECRQQ